MNLDYIHSHNVIDRYVLDQLSEQELLDFEMYFFEHPEILDEVEIARSLKRGLTAQEASLKVVTATSDEEAKPSLLDVVAGWFQSPLVLGGNFAAMAALLVLVLLPGEEPGPSAFTGDRVWIGQVRGESAALSISLEANSLVLDIDIQGEGPYRVSLLDANDIVLRNVEQVASVEDSLLVIISTHGISTGSHTLQVTDSQGVVAVQRELIFTKSN